MTSPPTLPIRIACLADDTPRTAAVLEAIAAQIPMAMVSITDMSVIRGYPDAHCVIIDTAVGATPGADMLRLLRARGYAGGAMLLVAEHSEPPVQDAAQLGAALCVLGDGFVRALPKAFTSAMTLRGDTPPDDPVTAAIVNDLRRTQRLLAAGEIALRLQHTLNNPLAALLAEAQLLELEELSEEHRQSVQQIIELCRRVIDVVRGLDGIGG